MCNEDHVPKDIDEVFIILNFKEDLNIRIKGNKLHIF